MLALLIVVFAAICCARVSGTFHLSTTRNMGIASHLILDWTVKSEKWRKMEHCMVSVLLLEILHPMFHPQLIPVPDLCHHDLYGFMS